MSHKYYVHPTEQRLRDLQARNDAGDADRHAPTCAAMVVAHSGAELVDCDCGFDERCAARAKGAP